MKIDFTRHKIFPVSQIIFVLVLIACTGYYAYAGSQLETCNKTVDDLGNAQNARMAATQGHIDKNAARLANIKARNPELAKQLIEQQRKK